MKALFVAPMDMIEEDMLAQLEAAIGRVFGFEVKRLPFREISFNAYDEKRNQFNSAIMLKEMTNCFTDEMLRLIGITEKDLCIPMLSFVFGHAQLNGSVAIMSLARLRQKFYQLPSNKNLLIQRAVKEAIHELGHTFGLVHCADPTCAMSLSTAIQLVDRKADDFCPTCSIFLEENIKKITSEIKVEG